ncbi:L,D-transpeptidase family protein [Paraferrimonas sedimenticola]|uniref:L,D-TPase catalytic domain-containing protein n=1 Tax=Paraferrimonas sedimenticola TaxID=375674 RepID=A0AA37RUM4_9GAMM|nr:L,D-transpeptidase family protein [Paraferrimonas sedimenticola]GLP95656.1 hypothetical protein GCM10007895_09620 [Paraferrimonas sedimenticola]
MFSRVALLMLTLLLGLSQNAWAQPEVDWVHVDKSIRKMYLKSGDEVVKEYRIALGSKPKGHKRKEGDQRTPEGWYTLDYKKEDSYYYRSFHIDYPNAKDRRIAKALGVSPGGRVMIHGQKPIEAGFSPLAQNFDWTNGCIAVTNDEMDEVMSLVKEGTPIFIEW